MSDVLIHHTIETGDTRRSPRSEVSQETIDLLRAVLLEALALSRGEAGTHAVEIEPTQWHVAAVENAGVLTAQLWFGAILMGDPHIVMTVRRGDPPMLRASAAGLMQLPDDAVTDAALEAGDLERCLAWAWVSLASDDAPRS